LLIKVHTAVEVDVPLNTSLFPSPPKTDTHIQRPSCVSSVCQHVLTILLIGPCDISKWADFL